MDINIKIPWLAVTASCIVKAFNTVWYLLVGLTIFT